MGRTIWGLDLGDWSLKVARADYDKKSGTLTVNLYDEIIYGELECGYEASTLEKHREGIIAFRKKYQIGGSDDLCVAVAGNEVFSRFINLPPVPESIDEIIRYEARQQIPFDIDDVVWDYQPVKDEHEVGEEIEVGLFALKKERVQELLDLLEPWRGNLRVVQDAPLAVFNLLSYEGLVETPSIVVEVGAATTNVLVLNPPRFWVRTLLVAGDDLTNALVEKFGISVGEAESIKRRAGRTPHKDQILRILQPIFDDLIAEVQRSLGYYKSSFREAKFERIIALGSGLKMTGLAKILAGGLQYQVQSVTELKRIKLAPNMDAERFQAALSGACVALGLLVQGTGQSRVRINMVPEEVALASAISEKKPWAAVALVGLLAGIGVLVLGQGSSAQGMNKADQSVAWNVVSDVKKVEQEYAAEAKTTDELRAQLETLTTPGLDRGLYLEILSGLTEGLPRDVYLMNMEFNWSETAARSAAATVPKSAAAKPTTKAKPAAAKPAAPARVIQTASYSENSGLVVDFTAESMRVSKEYVDNDVMAALKSARFPGTDIPLFLNVKKTSDVVNVYRDATTGSEVSSPAPGSGAQTIWFLSFHVQCTINIGKTGGQQ